MKKLILTKEDERWVVQLEGAETFSKPPCILIGNKQEVKQFDIWYELLCDLDELFRMREKEYEKSV